MGDGAGGPSYRTNESSAERDLKDRTYGSGKRWGGEPTPAVKAMPLELGSFRREDRPGDARAGSFLTKGRSPPAFARFPQDSPPRTVGHEQGPGRDCRGWP